MKNYTTFPISTNQMMKKIIKIHQNQEKVGGRPLTWFNRYLTQRSNKPLRITDILLIYWKMSLYHVNSLVGKYGNLLTTYCFMKQEFLLDEVCNILEPTDDKSWEFLRNSVLLGIKEKK